MRIFWAKYKTYKRIIIHPTRIIYDKCLAVQWDITLIYIYETRHYRVCSPSGTHALVNPNETFTDFFAQCFMILEQQNHFESDDFYFNFFLNTIKQAYLFWTILLYFTIHRSLKST